MVFSSAVFLFLFLPIMLLTYCGLVRCRIQNIWLLAASLLFYAWGEQLYVMVMLASITFNYVMGLLVSRTRDLPRLCKSVLTLAIVGNLAMLGYYKYGHFLTGNLNALLAVINIEPLATNTTHLPIGISFFTFQAMSYVIDVYRKEVPVQKNPLDIGLYISMFPQLIAGPIVRYKTVAAEISSRVMSLSGFATGIRIFSVGLGKKMILANTFARIADGVFDIPASNVPAATAWLGLLAYTLQIYFDFSGYSDMAVGLGRMLGFHFPRNFNYPYMARSIRDFWQRWHISLSSWLRDYLYIPLGGSRGSKQRTYINLIIVFLLCGLWHGASWNFVFWGLFHGVFLVIERITGKHLPARIPPLAAHSYALLVVMIGWVLFRTETLTETGAFLAGMAGMHGWSSAVNPALPWLTNPTLLCLAVAIPACTPIGMSVQRAFRNAIARQESIRILPLLNLAGECAGLLFIWTISAMLLAKGTHNPFIYFRF